MAIISKIKPGQTLYDVRRNTGFNAFRERYLVYPVLVEEVNVEEGYIVARWNVLNPPRKMYHSTIKNLRYKQPKSNHRGQ
jgi:hypothetical protein